MIRLLLTAALFITCFASCKKDDGPQGERAFSTMEPQNDRALKTSSYSYDRRNRVAIFQTSDVTTEDFHSEMIRFDTTGKISFTYVSNEFGNVGAKAKEVEYDADGRVGKVILFSSYSGLKDGYDSLAYDNGNKIVGIYHYEIDGVIAPYLLTRKDMMVRDARGRVTERREIPVYRNTESTRITTITYTYDEKPNYKGSSFTHFIFDAEESAGWMSSNNVITKTTQYPDGSVQTITNAYTYDADNFATSVSQNEQLTRGGTMVSNRTTSYNLKYTFLLPSDL